MKRIALFVIAALIGISGTVAAQSAPLSIDEMKQLNGRVAQLAPGFETWLHEYVERGARPDDESLEAFLDDIGYDSHLTSNGWRWFDVPYRATKASVHVKMDDAGRNVLLRLDLTTLSGGSASQLLTTTLIADAAGTGAGVFKASPEGTLGLYAYIDAKSVNDAVLMKVIDMLVDRAERTAPLWTKR